MYKYELFINYGTLNISIFIKQLKYTNVYIENFSNCSYFITIDNYVKLTTAAKILKNLLICNEEKS